MTFTTNQLLYVRKEENCFSVTMEREYYKVGNSFIKRSLCPREWQITSKGTIHVPRSGRERLLNETAVMTLIREKTKIPAPVLHCSFEDDDAVYLIMKYVEGVSMTELEDEQRAVVQQELEQHLQTMKGLRSSRIGGPSGITLLPYRGTLHSPRDKWSLKESDSDEYVFCHNDLSVHNVVVDSDTLKIRAILDWEYAGFYPEWFERRFFERIWPSVAIREEVDDAEKIMKSLLK
jgi:serine/threonine protein kinase